VNELPVVANVEEVDGLIRKKKFYTLNHNNRYRQEYSDVRVIKESEQAPHDEK